MAERIVKTPEQLARLAAFMTTLKLPLTVSWKAGVDRTRKQNSLQWMWAQEVAAQAGDRGPEVVQAEFKLLFGVPILREDDEFQDKYDRSVGRLGYSAQLLAMETGFHVSRLMTKPQMNRYLDEIFETMTQQGYDLTRPDPEMRDYMTRYMDKPE